MPLTWTVLREPPVLVVRVGTSLSPQDILAYQHETLGLPETHGLDEIFDLSECEAFTASADGVSQVVEGSAEVQEVCNAGRLAILAPTDLSFGLARMYVSLAEIRAPGREIQVCRSLADLVAFLQLPGDWTMPPA